MLGIDPERLPRPLPPASVFGTTSEFGGEVPVAGIAGDQQSALFGQGCTAPGMAKNTYGTGCFLLLHTGQRPVESSHGLLTTVACDERGRTAYALEGAVFVAGAVIQWLRDGLGLLARAAESEKHARSVEDSLGVYVVPAFVGLGAPYWDPDARGAVLGLTRGVTRAHLIRATLESLAFQTRDLMDAMAADAGAPLSQLRVDGGAAANDFLMQFQADLLGVPVERPSLVETTAIGAAQLAGLAVGFWQSPRQLAATRRKDRRFRPRMTAERREALYRGWREAVSRVRTRPTP
jgi:glycerol kinase